MLARTCFTGALVALLLAAAGCGSSDSGSSSSKKPATLTVSFSGTGKQPDISVPKSVKGPLVTLKAKNDAKGDHSPQLVSYSGGHTAQEAAQAGDAWGSKGKPLPSWLKLPGGLGTVKAGSTDSVTVSLKPGTYAVVDTDTGANKEFKVTGGGASGSVPKSSSTIQATEYAFKSSGLTAGNDTITFKNAGGQPHFIAAAPIKPGKTIADVKQALKTQKGAPPIDQAAAVNSGVIDGGGEQQIHLPLKKGNYALICFVPDRQGGPPHFTKGMISAATVK